VIIITALLKVFVLGHNLAKHMWLGVIINFAAMCIVSAPSFLQPEASPDGRDPRIGIMFIVASCVVQGSQYVFEEKVMQVDGAPPLVVVGMEGFWGMILSVVICWPVFYLLPGSDKGSMENMWDAVVMLENHPALLALCGVFFVSVALYNVFAVFITHLLSSIWHAILDNFRPVAVWTTDLLLFYWITNGQFGEEWAWPASYLQLLGMIILFFGTGVYNGSVPFLLWSDANREEDQALLQIQSKGGTPRGVIQTNPTMASPYLMRSPLVQPGPKKLAEKSNGYGATRGRRGSR